MVFIEGKVMKLSEFTLTNTIGNTPLNTTHFAEVTVTTQTGALWWKNTYTERKKIFRNTREFWQFSDTGEHTPDFQAEELEQAWRACAKLLATRRIDNDCQ